MRFLLLILCLPFIINSQTQIGSDLHGANPGDTFGEKVAMSSNGQIIAVASPLANGVNMLSGSVRVYKNISGVWEQLGQDIEGEGENDISGRSIALSSEGNVVAIGATGNTDLAGHVRVYQFINEVWTQVGQDIDGEAELDSFGFSVALSSDGLIVSIGGRFNNGNGTRSGHVRVLEYDGNSWSQIGDDIDGEMANDESGFSVDLSADGAIIAIGAVAAFNNNNGQTGHVRVFENNNGNWEQIGEDIDGEAAGDSSGSSVSLSSNGQIVSIGATQNSGNGNAAGHVRVYETINDSWIQKGQDIDGESPIDLSGFSLDMSSNGDILAIGSRWNDGNGVNSGHVRIYQYYNGIWEQRGVDIDGDELVDLLGSSVALSGDSATVVIGAPGNDVNGDAAGQAKVFDLSELLALARFNENLITMYPNPTKDGFYIELPNNESLKKVELYTSQGQHITTENSTYISTNTFANGVYIVKITTSKRVLIRKVVVD